MRTWALLCLLLSLRVKVEGKRFDPFMVDPLMRRSPLDRNFMRFGRSLPLKEPGDKVTSRDSWPKDEVRITHVTNLHKVPPIPRAGRGRDENFLRLGRSRNDNNFMRFGRSRQDSFVRFGRGREDGFMRFGKGKPDNFIRFGRGKQDNFMRFGRDSEDQNVLFPNNNQFVESGIFRDSRGKQDNFIRFGRNFFDDTERYEPVALRGVLSMPNRDNRGRQESFIRFGKGSEKEVLPSLEDYYDMSKPNDIHDLFKSTDSKRVNLARVRKQHPPNKDDSFIRFGRNSNEQFKEDSEVDELIPPRLKRSTLEFYSDNEENLSKTTENDDNSVAPLTSLHEYVEEEFSPSEQPEDYSNRRKRSISSPTSNSTFKDSESIPNKPLSGQPVQVQTSLLPNSLPNFIVAPELSLLPDLDPPSMMLSGSGPHNQDFLRLG